MTFLMAGGGTGGHVMPALAVARELTRRGHQPFFIGTRTGMEASLVPAAGFPIEWIEIGGLKRVGLMRTLRTMIELPLSTLRSAAFIGARSPGAVFSMGGYVAGPVTFAAWLKRIPIVLMEPNAMPGFTSRRTGRMAARALLNFAESAKFFPPGRTEITGLPVREEFFRIPERPPSGKLTVLITGGSRGSRTLNNAAEASWPLFHKSDLDIRIIHQAGVEAHSELSRRFESSGLRGEVLPFINDMPKAFAGADIIVCRSGAGAVAEVAAAGKPAILVPFPFAADQHQLRNAEAMQRAGAARLLLDSETTGPRLFQEIRDLAASPAQLTSMSEAARRMAHPGAASRAADVLEELGRR